MAWHYFLSIEPLALEVAEKSIAAMTTSNYRKGEYCDDENEPVPNEIDFLNNYQNGFIALIMLSCYFDSCLNSLLRDLIGIEEDSKVYKANKYERLSILFDGKENELDGIMNTPDWVETQKAFQVRNSLIHYRSNIPHSVSYLPISSWRIDEEIVGEFFTKGQIQRCSDAIKAVVAAIAKVFELDMTTAQRVIGFTGNTEGDISPFRKSNGDDLAYAAYIDKLNALIESWNTIPE